MKFNLLIGKHTQNNMNIKGLRINNLNIEHHKQYT